MPLRRKSASKGTQQSANARGFAKRQERRKTRESRNPDDAYEFDADAKTRRSKVALDLDRDDEARANNSDSDGSADDLRARIAKRVQEDTVASEDDEDIDSDDAFAESDNERFAGHKFSEKKQKKSARSQKRGQVNLDEDDSDGAGVAEEDDQTAYDPLAMLDGKSPLAAADGDEDDEDEDEDEDMDEDAEEAEEDSEDEGADQPMSDVDENLDEDALDNLGQFIAGLDTSKKRKVREVEDADSAGPQPKRRLLKERTEAGVEGEFNLRSGKLQLDDLLAPLSSTTASSLKASTKVLKGSGPKSGPLAAPLPGRTQDRLDREAAYAQTKEEVDKWKATMKQIKEAEHLSFPLQPPETVGVSTHELAAKFKPSTELESAVDKLLRTAGLRDQDIEKTEALKMNHLSVEEVAARRAELLRTRELMFRADAKAKRVARIKSKAFRRIRKKQREKLGEDLDEDADEEEEILRLETARAKERATLKHKNTGKWAKAMQQRGELDEDQRRDINEMLAKGERLRRRIQGVGSGDESEGDEDEDADVGDIKQRAFDELAQLDEEPSAGGKLKGVFEMKFMKDAMARRAREADTAAEELRAELANVDAEAAAHESDAEPTQETVPVVSDRVNGRMTFNPSDVARNGTGMSAMSDASSVTMRSFEPPPTLVSSPGAGPSTLPSTNPWLARPEDTSGKVARKKNEVLVSKNSSTMDKAQHSLQKQRKKQTGGGAETDDAVVEINMTDVLQLSAPAQGGLDDDEDANSEKEEQEKIEAEKRSKANGKGKAKAKGKQPAFKQRELVALAFAGDNVVEDFAELKRQEIEADAPKVEDTTLPGWGAWGGQGSKKQKPKPHLLKTTPGIDPTQRADHGKAHVIISEKKDKKAAKYLVKDLPFPYTSKAQFERTLEAPIGAEWNTRVGFQRGTLPHVVKKMGTVIAPVRKNI